MPTFPPLSRLTERKVPATFKVNGENRWITYYDFYYDGYFGASTTTNLVDWTAYDSSEISLPSGIRHGSVIPITEAEKDALLNAWDPNDYERFESHNYPGYFIRHYNYEARIDNNVSPEADSYFRVVPGLADPNLVSLESVNYPGYYLRHYDYQIRLDPDDGTNIFKEDATFEIVPGLADSSKISFESYNYPGYYIRHWDYNLRIEEITDDIGRQDATFQRIQP